MSSLLKGLDGVIEGLAALFMATMVVVVFLGVVYRYLLVSPLPWIEEIARLFLVWVSFLGSYLAMRRGQHIAIDMIPARLGGGWRRAADALGGITVAVLLLTLGWYGTRYALTFMHASSPYLGFPVGLVYFAMPIGAVLLLVAAFFSASQELLQGALKRSRGRP